MSSDPPAEVKKEPPVDPPPDVTILARSAFDDPVRYLRALRFAPHANQRKWRFLSLRNKISSPFIWIAILGLSCAGGFLPYAIACLLDTSAAVGKQSSLNSEVKVQLRAEIEAARNPPATQRAGGNHSELFQFLIPNAEPTSTRQIPASETAPPPPLNVQLRGTMQSESLAQPGPAGQAAVNDRPASTWDPEAAAWAAVVLTLALSIYTTNAAQRSEIFATIFSRRRELNKDLVEHPDALHSLVEEAVPTTPEVSTGAPGSPTPKPIAPPPDAAGFVSADFLQHMYVYGELDTLEFMYENYRDGFLGNGKHFVRACLIFQSRCGSPTFLQLARECLVNGRYAREEFVRGVTTILDSVRDRPNHHGFPESFIDYVRGVTAARR